MMLPTTFSHFLAVLASLIQTQTFHFPIQRENPDTQYTFQCADATWVGTPTIRGGILEATLTANCDVTLKTAGNFDRLQNHLSTHMAGENVKVNAGPTAETYKNMPSKFFDLTVSVEEQGEHLTLDEDVHIATNSQDLLLYDTVSRRIMGTGMSKYLLSMNAFAQITTEETANPQHFRMSFTDAVRIQKPSLVPGGVFLSQVTSRLKAAAKTHIPKLVPPIAEGLLE